MVKLYESIASKCIARATSIRVADGLAYEDYNNETGIGKERTTLQT